MGLGERRERLEVDLGLFFSFFLLNASVTAGRERSKPRNGQVNWGGGSGPSDWHTENRRNTARKADNHPRTMQQRKENSRPPQELVSTSSAIMAGHEALSRESEDRAAGAG